MLENQKNIQKLQTMIIMRNNLNKNLILLAINQST